MTSRVLRALALLVAVLTPASLRAQCKPGGPPNPAAIQRAIVGIVMDTAHQPVENAEIFVRQPKRSARTDARGIFQLTDLNPGRYELVVRRIGYEVAIQEYVVTDSGGVARFCLLSEAQGMEAMITSVPRGGLTGIVGDTAFSVVAGAEVRIMGENRHTLSDSAGGFFFPLEPGTYALVVKKSGYGPQLVGVTIPKDSGRKINVWLGSPPRNPHTYAIAIDGIRERIQRTPAHRYHMVTSEDLAKTDMDLTQAIRVAARSPISDDCEAVIAGTDFTLPIYMLNKADVAMLEVVGGPLRRPGPRGVTSINGSAAPRPLSACSVSVVVWMKP